MVRKNAFIFLAAFVLPVGLALWWWGTFADADINVVERGPYRYAYRVYSGDYSKIPQWKGEITRALEAQGVARELPVTVLLNDPRTTPVRQRQVHIGYLVAADTLVTSPLLVGSVPRRRVVLVEVRASPLMAPGKAYAALIDYCQDKGIAFRLPTFELYNSGVLAVEMDHD